MWADWRYQVRRCSICRITELVSSSPWKFALPSQTYEVRTTKDTSPNFAYLVSVMWSRLKQKVSSNNRFLSTKVEQSLLDTVSRCCNSPVWSAMREWCDILVLTGIPRTLSRTHTPHTRGFWSTTRDRQTGDTGRHTLERNTGGSTQGCSGQYFAEISKAVHFVSTLPCNVNVCV